MKSQSGHSVKKILVKSLCSGIGHHGYLKFSQLVTVGSFHLLDHQVDQTWHNIWSAIGTWASLNIQHKVNTRAEKRIIKWIMNEELVQVTLRPSKPSINTHPDTKMFWAESLMQFREILCQKLPRHFLTLLCIYFLDSYACILLPSEYTVDKLRSIHISILCDWSFWRQKHPAYIKYNVGLCIIIIVIIIIVIILFLLIVLFSLLFLLSLLLASS